ncbi:ABC transporter ATP-binding protein [Desulfococcaceae bacterium HSG7]|nr:ABC transporter ATP-binding protein [Desulfococcaceae bacterium HSG7]
MRTDYGYFEEDKLGKPYDIQLLKRFYPFARPYNIWFTVSIILIIVITLLELTLPYLTKIAIDRYIVPKEVLTTATSATSDPKPTRVFTVDLTHSEHKKIVAAYPEIFDIRGSTARIAYDDLAVLKTHELVLLRRDDLKGINRIAIIFMMVVAGVFILNFIQIMVMETTGQRIMHDLRMRLFTHIQQLSASFFNRNPVGRLVTRVTNDIQNMHELFTSVIKFVFKDIFLLVGITIVLINLNLRLAMVSFTVLPIVLIISFRFSGKARLVFRDLRVKVAQINTRFAETIGGIKVIQLFAHENHNYREFKKLNHANYLAGMRQVRVFALFMPLIELLGSIVLAMIIYYGGGRVLTDQVSLGDLVAFITYIKMFFRPIRDLADKYNIMQNAMASAERIFLLLDKNGNQDQNKATSETAVLPARLMPTDKTKLKKINKIEFDNVSFEYVPDENVLDSVSFTIRSEETVAIVGPTGSGKTTLIHLITRFYDTTNGRIRVNGSDIKNFEPALIRSKIALVMQDPFLFSGTIRDNIISARTSLSERQLTRIVAASKLSSLINGLPDGLDTVLSESGGSLSSGERQLISIARAFAADPDMIILDEATSYIDSQTEQKIQQAILTLMQNRTSLVVAHRLTTARQADNIIVLNKGRIIEQGNHDALMKMQGFYYKMNRLRI